MVFNMEVIEKKQFHSVHFQSALIVKTDVKELNTKISRRFDTKTVRYNQWVKSSLQSMQNG